MIEQRAHNYIASGPTEREALDIPEIADVDAEAREVKERVAKVQAKVHIAAFLSPVPIAYVHGVDGSTLNAGLRVSRDYSGLFSTACGCRAQEAPSCPLQRTLQHPAALV